MGVSTWTGLIDKGFYRFIRHPQLALQLMRRFVFVLGFPSLWNAFTGVFFIFAVVAIIKLEEKYLQKFYAYRLYSKNVKYRLLPAIW
jgi:protein-S-isoprenylcysteine O-methyltransferase Ste14